jgi:hypothetical protein
MFALVLGCVKESGSHNSERHEFSGHMGCLVTMTSHRAGP